MILSKYNKISKLIIGKNFISLVIFIFIILILPANLCFSYDYYAAGKRAYKDSNYNKAVYYFNKALKKFPDNTKCRYYYAQSLIHLKNFKKAQKEYEKILEKSPLSQEAKLASIGISKIKKYQLYKKGEIAVSNISNINSKVSAQKVEVKSVGDNYIINALDGSKVTRWHSDKMPIKLYVEKSVNEPGYKDYYYTMAQKAMHDWVNSAEGNLISYKLTDNPKEADIQLYFEREILKKTGNEFIAGLATPHIKKHILYYYDIKITSQTPADGRSFTQNEIYRTILHELGHALGIRGHSSKKTDIMYAGVETDPKNKDAGLSQRDINTLTLLYTLEPDISNFGKDEKVNPDSGRNEEILGSKQERLNKKLQEAIDYTKKYPNNILSWIQLGKAYKDLKNYDQAISSLNKALEIEDTYPGALESLAFVYKDKGDFNKASEYFEKLIQIEPKNIGYSHNYALFLIENKKYGEARQVLYDLRARNPKAISHPDIMNLMDYLSRT